jgi:hypothetical protein
MPRSALVGCLPAPIGGAGGDDRTRCRAAIDSAAVQQTTVCTAPGSGLSMLAKPTAPRKKTAGRDHFAPTGRA